MSADTSCHFFLDRRSVHALLMSLLAPTTTTQRAVVQQRLRDRTPWAAFVLTGAIGGVLSGLFAIGGAVVMVPLLMWRTDMDQRRAAATSLVAIVPTAVVSSATYLLHADLDVVAAAWIATGAIGGAVIGTRLLRRLPMTWLRWLFIGFLLLIAAHLVMTTHADTVMSLPHSTMIRVLDYISLGLLTGIASGLFGIGGAIISVPLLGSVFALSDAVAKGTALLVSIPTSLVGTATNRRSRNAAVDVRAGWVLGATAAAASVPAVYLSVALPPAVSAVTFAILLVAIAGHLGVAAIRAGRTSHRNQPTEGVRP